MSTSLTSRRRLDSAQVTFAVASSSNNNESKGLNTSTNTSNCMGENATNIETQASSSRWKRNMCEASIMASVLTILPFVIYSIWQSIKLLFTHTIVFGWSWIASFIISLIITRLHEEAATAFLGRIRQRALFIQECESDEPVEKPPEIKLNRSGDGTSTTLNTSRRIASAAMYSSTSSNPEIQVMRAGAYHRGLVKIDEGSDEDTGPYLRNGNFLDDIEPDVSPSNGTTNFLRHNLHFTPDNSE